MTSGTGDISGVPPPEFSSERNQWLALDDRTLLEQCRQEFFVATGNGGQKRNRTNSAVRLTHHPSGLATVDCSTRSQHQNRDIALRKLRLEIALQIRGEPAGPAEVKISMTNPAYPQLVAWLMDLLTAWHWEPRDAAEATGITRTGLVKLLARDPKLWQYFNWNRERHGLTPLHRP